MTCHNDIISHFREKCFPVMVHNDVIFSQLRENLFHAMVWPCCIFSTDQDIQV